MQAAGRGHPARGPVRPGPRPAQPAVRPEVLVQPAVAVGGGDPLGLAPLEQRRDQRMGLAQGPQPPGPGVGHVHPDRGQQRLDLGRAAQVGGGPGGRVPQHVGVPRGPVPGRLGLVAGPRPDEPGQYLPGRGPAHRQAVGRQFRAQQFGRGLRVRGGPGHGPAVQPGQRVLLEQGRRPGQLGPPGQPLRAVPPVTAGPLGADVPARADRLVRVAAVALGEQVRWPAGRQRGQLAGVQPGPGQGRVRPPAAEQQPVHGRDVPARGHPDLVGGQGGGRFTRPDHPAGAQLLVDPGHHGGQVRRRLEAPTRRARGPAPARHRAPRPGRPDPPGSPRPGAAWSARPRRSPAPSQPAMRHRRSRTSRWSPLASRPAWIDSGHR